MSKNSYVLITAAKNEEAHIQKTLESVVKQTIPPKKWIIVSDGSTDLTDEIVNSYVVKHDFIHLIRKRPNFNRSFASKVKAIRTGFSQLKEEEFEFIGNLDADVSFEESYYEVILSRFHENDRLGIAGGTFFDVCKGKFHEVIAHSNSVGGAIQMFRRQCYQEIGGFTPLKMGGVDAVAEVIARMYGWEVRSFPDVKVLHHRPTGTEGRSIWGARFRQGIECYSLGYDPLFFLLRCVYRIVERPYFIGSTLTMLGYWWSYSRRDVREVPSDFIDYLRQEQLSRLRSLFSSLNKEQNH